MLRTPNSHIIESKSSVKKLSNRKPSDPQVGLADQIQMLPTPTDSMVTMQDMVQAKYAGNSGKRPKYKDAKMLATPQVRDYRSHKRQKSSSPYRMLNEDIGNIPGLKLQPSFVEWMFHLPIGYTELKDLKPSETQSNGKSL